MVWGHGFPVGLDGASLHAGWAKVGSVVSGPESAGVRRPDDGPGLHPPDRGCGGCRESERKDLLAKREPGQRWAVQCLADGPCRLMETEVRKSARILGDELGLTAQEMNVMLENEGYLSGTPGNYAVTDKGGPYAREQDFHSGPGGYPCYNRDWSTRTWDDAILEQMRVTDDMRRNARDMAASIRRTRRAQRDADCHAGPELLEQLRSDQDEEGPDGSGDLSVGALLILVVGTITVAAAGWWVVAQLRRSRRRSDPRNKDGFADGSRGDRPAPRVSTTPRFPDESVEEAPNDRHQ